MSDSETKSAKNAVAVTDAGVAVCVKNPVTSESFILLMNAKDAHDTGVAMCEAAMAYLRLDLDDVGLDDEDFLDKLYADEDPDDGVLPS